MKTAAQKLADLIDSAEAFLVVELPENGTRRLHHRLSVGDEVLLVEALRAYQQEGNDK